MRLATFVLFHEKNIQLFLKVKKVQDLLLTSVALPDYLLVELKTIVNSKYVLNVHCKVRMKVRNDNVTLKNDHGNLF